MTEAIPAAPPQPGQPGWMLGGRYRVVDRIGAGGMAEVFRAHDQLLARDVAVKVFRTHTDPDEVTGGVQRHELELQTLARLSHPNLITLFDGSIGSDGEPAFLVMELINGPSLAAQIAQAPLTEPMAREIAAQIAAALAYVHSQNMVHRDIKPANILLGSDGVAGEATGNPLRARLSDFGIVRLLGSEHLTSADLMVGTASYLAPEQARGAEVGPPADVYALGLVLIEALTGRRSFEGPALETALARLERSPEIPAGLPQPWPALLQAMTAMDPEARPTAAEVSRTLRDGVAVPVAADATRRRGARRRCGACRWGTAGCRRRAGRRAACRRRVRRRRAVRPRRVHRSCWRRRPSGAGDRIHREQRAADAPAGRGRRRPVPRTAAGPCQPRAVDRFAGRGRRADHRPDGRRPDAGARAVVQGLHQPARAGGVHRQHPAAGLGHAVPLGHRGGPDRLTDLVAGRYQLGAVHQLQRAEQHAGQQQCPPVQQRAGLDHGSWVEQPAGDQQQPVELR